MIVPDGKDWTWVLERMLAEDGPHYENWDQDATALDERYDEQAPATAPGSPSTRSPAT